MSLTTYVKETKAEMKHVTWPTRRQAVSYTVLVIGTSLFLSLFLSAFDYGFEKLLSIALSLK